MHTRARVVAVVLSIASARHLAAGSARHGGPGIGQVLAAAFEPPACSSQFLDVPASNPLCPWIEQLVADGVSNGCAEDSFCPDQPVSRQQVALLLERAMRGTATWQADAGTLDGLDSTAFVQASALNWASLRRKFYLTTTTATGAGATQACAAGYHMASKWEIGDLGGLVYDTQLGVGKADSGAGPPSNEFGWVRTGFSSYSAEDAGAANCSAWTSTSGYGTATSLEVDWHDQAIGYSFGNFPWWRSITVVCTGAIRVWCVED